MNGKTHSTARNGFRKHSLALALAASFTTAGVAQAATWEITVTNLTNGNHFAPLLLTAHDHDTNLFQVGMPASEAIEHMAECGHLGALIVSVDEDAGTVANPVGGTLDPGRSTDPIMLTTTTEEDHLSVVSMLLPTNDAFLGLGSQHIPSDAGTYTYYVNAYDAGTEANDEILMTSGNCAIGDSGMMPDAPGDNAGTGGSGVATADGNTMVHVHRGVLGDQEAAGGVSDLDSTIHRWQNPVARITVTVTP